MYRFMSKQFIALFAGLLVLCSIQFISPPKMRGLILRRKTGPVSVKVFTFHVHLTCERHTGTEGREPLLSCSVYFVRIPLPFELIFFCINVQKTGYCFDVIHHALKIQRKTVVQTKLKQHVITGLYYLLHISAGIEKDTVD